MNIITLRDLYTTQRSIGRLAVLGSLVRAISEDLPLPAVLLAEREDRSIQIQDGHHRCLAYLMSGRSVLLNFEYELLLEADNRPRFRKLGDLI